MTKETLKTVLITILSISIIVLIRQNYILKVEVERRAMQDVMCEMYSAGNFIKVAETENEWKIGTKWLEFTNRAFEPNPQEETTRRVLKVCKALPNLEFGSEEYAKAKILMEDGLVRIVGSKYKSCMEILDEAKFEQLEAILGIST